MENEKRKNKFTDYYKLQSGCYISSPGSITGSIYQPEQCQENHINSWFKTAVFFQYFA